MPLLSAHLHYLFALICVGRNYYFWYFSTIYLLITFHLPGNPRLLSYPCRTPPVLFLAFHPFTLSLFHPVHLSLRIFCETLETLFYNPLIFQPLIVSHYCHTISLSQLSHFIFAVSL